jgi:hypothetical protein
VQVAIDNLPVHAWNAQVVRTVLGDDCLFDKIELATSRQDATDIFFCWAWMWNPDFLHRVKLMTIFPSGAGQSPDLGVAPPPRGQVHKLIIPGPRRGLEPSARSLAELGPERPPVFGVI